MPRDDCRGMGEGAVLDRLPDNECPHSIQRGMLFRSRSSEFSANLLLDISLACRAPQDACEWDRPAGLGFLTKPRVHRSTALAAAAFGQDIMELEVCFRLGDRIPARALPPRESLPMLKAPMLASRSSAAALKTACPRRAGFLADDVGFHAYVLGDEVAWSDWPFAAPQS